MPVELGHSLVGASSCERWWNCPGSNALIATLPTPPNTKYAAEGTVAHALCEDVLRNKVHFDARWNATAKIGEIYEEDDYQFEVTEEMAEAANLYVNTILADAKRIECNLRKSVQLSGNNKEAWKHWDVPTQERINQRWVNIEQSFTLDDVDSEARGTNDASIYVPGETLIVYDFKYGKGVPVEAIENKQMLYYAIGAAGDKLMEFKSIELVIVQPRAEHPQGPVRRWVTTPQYVNAFKQELAKRIKATRTSDKTETGKWCRFCNAKMICPATRTKVNEIAKIDFQEPAKPNTLRTPDQLTPLELKTLLDNADLIENYIKDVREYAFNLLNRGGTVEGYKLVKGGKAHRKWENEELAASMLELEFGEDEIYKTSLKSPAQIEKLGNSAKEVVELYAVRPDSKLVLAKDEDVRERQNQKALADFDDIDLG